MAKTSKYRAIKTVYNGDKYDSKKEAAFAKTLDLLKESFKPQEKVLGYRRQVPFPIIVNEQNICTYILDFLITYTDGRIEYVDVKGYKKGIAYQHFKTKKKLVEALYNIQIIER